jgi:hypothetical protein
MRMRTSPNEGALEGTGVRRPGESSNRVVLPSGATETLAPAPALSVGITKHRAKAAPTGFTAADFADLPRPGDGTAVHGGLLAMEPTITDDQFIGQRMAGATPQRFQLGTHYPGTALGIGGGPANAATEGFPERMLSGRVPLR